MTRKSPPKSEEDAFDVSAAPAFTKFEDSSVWLAERLGEDYVRKCGRWELYQRSQRIPGFQEARSAWSSAWAEFLRRDGNREIATGQITPEKIFFNILKRSPSTALQAAAPLISAAASRGDVDFFPRIGNPIANLN